MIHAIGSHLYVHLKLRRSPTSFKGLWALQLGTLRLLGVTIQWARAGVQTITLREGRQGLTALRALRTSSGGAASIRLT